MEKAWKKLDFIDFHEATPKTNQKKPGILSKPKVQAQSANQPSQITAPLRTFRPNVQPLLGKWNTCASESP